MAKRSVYIPDRLWAEIQEQVRHLNLGVSEIVQNALRQAFGLAEGATTGAMRGRSRTRPVLDQDRLEAIRRRLQDEAQSSYDEGYLAGAEVAARLSWPELARGARGGWRLPPKPEDPLDSALGEVLIEAVEGDWRRRLEADPMLAQGIGDALEDIWVQVTGSRPDPPALPAPATPEPPPSPGTL